MTYFFIITAITFLVSQLNHRVVSVNFMILFWNTDKTKDHFELTFKNDTGKQCNRKCGFQLLQFVFGFKIEEMCAWQTGRERLESDEGLLLVGSVQQIQGKTGCVFMLVVCLTNCKCNGKNLHSPKYFSMHGTDQEKNTLLWSKLFF